uniref:Receptor-like serine/threonine-protein kinase n=1 Tax=Kalanchoe fedtschenkoi TaxID=63787 RepID=A0A7N0V5Y5_KALFE
MVALRAIHLLVTACSFVLLISTICQASIQTFGKISPGFKASPMTYIDKNGQFLLSNGSTFAFGFKTTEDVTAFLLVIILKDSNTVIWTANRGSTIKNSDTFFFGEDGNAYLESEGKQVWSTDTGGKGVVAVEMQESGNLVMLGSEGNVVWESFRHPSDTLISGQEFVEGMKLESDLSQSNLSYFLEIKSGDMILYPGFPTLQPYWSMGKDTRKTINQNGGEVTSARLDSNSWKFYDRSKLFLWQFIFSTDTNPNITWVAVLGDDGVINFGSLQSGETSFASAQKIPSNRCDTPEPCDTYSVCFNDYRCECPSGLASYTKCKPGRLPTCDQPSGNTELISAGDGLDYFALDYAQPSAKTDLPGCQDSCLRNCSCAAMFFRNSTGSCFMFDSIGSFRNAGKGSDVVSFIKVPSDGGGDSSGNHFPYVVIIAVVTVVVIIILLIVGFRYYKRKKTKPESVESPKDASDEDNFLESLSGMPIRFSYKDLEAATNGFTNKLGQGGFGCVYLGTLPDGSKIAVKQLEGIGQGKKEFRAEVSIIGSIHHVHLVKLRGFCAEGSHRLLAYEFMGNGSLERWIFKPKEGFLLDWDTRFNIALGTAKGLAYLHEDCDVKIVHCDIKPENVLLDENYHAKVSDFGLAKLMNREQSHVFTTLRGTRGYLAPEWITNYAISEKSDVYSYGMVLLEIIGGRKNYDPNEVSEKSHFPTYAFKMMEEGKLLDILDAKLKKDEHDERVSVALKVALWCIQDDMYIRPSMTKVVQMLEGVSPVPTPPTASQMGSRLYSSFLKSISSEGGTSSGPSDCNSDAYLSAVRLSGPR